MKDDFIKKLLSKDQRAVSRAISIAETNNEKSEELLGTISSKTGNAYRIGMTGPPGAGKSTITNQLVKKLREENKSVAVIAVDPTSPFTGGAILGDRVRMNEIGNDDSVFIRSMATRGSLGGLSKKANDAADVLDAAGFDFIILETVGVGQSELDIVEAADTTIVVLVPESGDSIQAMKAGLMEIGDLFVVNKSDRPGAEKALTSIKATIGFRYHDEKTWLPPALKVVAPENKGIDEIAAQIFKHKNFLEDTNQLQLKREERIRRRIKEIVESKLRKEIWNSSNQNSLVSSLKKITLGKSSPYKIAKEIIKNFKDKIRRV